MGTVVTVEVEDPRAAAEVEPAIARALGWLGAVEAACSRFDPASELRRLVERVGEHVPVSPLLLEPLRFALALAELTGGAFDPTVGSAMVARGFDRHYLTGLASGRELALDAGATYRDVALDPAAGTVRLARPPLLDLGAVAKGLAVDLVATELGGFARFSVDAGGDPRLGGSAPAGRGWRIGIQHPRDPDALVETLEVGPGAVCTSGDYERRTPDGRGHHLIDPRGGAPAGRLASVTVLAPTALAADGLATAAFVLGASRGRRLLDEQGVQGVLVDARGRVERTQPGRRALRLV